MKSSYIFNVIKLAVVSLCINYCACVSNIYDENHILLGEGGGGRQGSVKSVIFPFSVLFFPCSASWTRIYFFKILHAATMCYTAHLSVN